MSANPPDSPVDACLNGETTVIHALPCDAVNAPSVAVVCRQGIPHVTMGDDYCVNWLTEHPVKAGQRTVEQTLERMDVNVAFRRREGEGLPRVFALDRSRVRERGIERFGAMRMVDEYIAVYERLLEQGTNRGTAVLAPEVSA